jgi:hypothetical protein
VLISPSIPELCNAALNKGSLGATV